jgi:hypothetical protein
MEHESNCASYGGEVDDISVDESDVTFLQQKYKLQAQIQRLLLTCKLYSEWK